MPLSRKKIPVSSNPADMTAINNNFVSIQNELISINDTIFSHANQINFVNDKITALENKVLPTTIKTVADVDDFIILNSAGTPYRITKANLFAGLSSRGGDTLPGGGGDTPPGGGATADPYYANVINLLHFNGANGSTTFVDEKGSAITKQGTPVLDTSISKYGAASGRFTSSAGDYLELPQVNLGTRDFTIEMWVCPKTSFNDSFGICGQGNLYLSAFGGILNFWQGGGFTYSFGANPAINLWTHIAVSKSNGIIKLFINGILVNAVSNSSSFNTSGNFNIGKAGNDGKYWNGNLDNLRLTVDTGRYIASFNPETDTYLN